MANGKYDRAIEILDAAIANNVWENGKTPYYLAYALIQTEKYDRAKEVLSEGLKRFPGDKNLIETMIGYYGLTGGDFNEIKAMLEEALQNNPENASIWNGLAQIYKSSEDTEKSIEFFTRYVAQFPESVQSNYYLGDILYEKANRIVDSIKDDKTMSKASRDTANEQAKDIYRQAWKYLKVAYEGETSPQMAIIQRYLHTTFMLIDDPGMQEVYDKVEPIFQAMLDAQQN
jgi:tetratricopeptide (TPR) repeat protein